MCKKFQKKIPMINAIFFFQKSNSSREKNYVKKTKKNAIYYFFICGYCLEEGQGNNFYLVHY